MKIAHISAGAAPHRNDDHVAVMDHAGTIDILVIDGGTSVAGRDYLDPVNGDVTWFVHAFTAALEQALAPGRGQQECVHAAIDVVRARFEEKPGQGAMPLHAWPIAAMTWLRVDEQDGAQRVALYSLGDCKSPLHTAAGECVDLDPFVNPQDAVLQAEIAKLREEGVADPEQRRERWSILMAATRMRRWWTRVSNGDCRRCSMNCGRMRRPPAGPGHARSRRRTMRRPRCGPYSGWSLPGRRRIDAGVGTLASDRSWSWQPIIRFNII